jgi:hypothetical protein
VGRLCSLALYRIIKNIEAGNFFTQMKFIYQNKVFGIEPGKYVRIYQGFDTKDGHIHLKSESVPGQMSFDVFDTVPTLHWGMGIYLVRKDHTLLKISEDFDSSD